MVTVQMQRKFSLGKTVMTDGIAALAEENPDFFEDVFFALGRFVSGDWGDICEEDKGENELALKHEGRLMGVYESGGTVYWIITECDRSVTTVLLPEEY
jgi:3'-phosphoadenosine 5'-phosphosulfate sulfotransferase